VTEYKTNIAETQVGIDGRIVSVRFTVTASDIDVQASITSEPDYAVIDAASDAAPGVIAALCEKSDQYARAKANVHGRMMTAKPYPKIEPGAPVVEITDAEQRAIWVQGVDDLVASIIGRFTRFQMGYVEREAAARAYIASDGASDPTVWVTRFADNNGMDYMAASERIVFQAEAYRQALEELEALRMDKYRITKASTADLARLEFAKIVSQCGVIQRSLP